MTDHQIIFGDSQNMTELDDESVHIAVTSPPYVTTKMNALVKHIVGESKHLSKNVPQRFLAGFAIDSSS
jgi:DNA modification methylase